MDKISKFKSLWNRVVAWGEKRDLYNESTIAHQASKCLSEMGEYVVSLAEGKSRSDDIGDTAVCLIHCIMFRRKQSNGTFDPITRADLEGFLEPPVGLPIEGATWALAGSLVIQGHYGAALMIVIQHANEIGLDFLDCLLEAVEEIEPRRGLFINKYFVKWDNLTDDQRVACLRREEEAEVAGLGNEQIN